MVCRDVYITFRKSVTTGVDQGIFFRMEVHTVFQIFLILLP